MSVLALVPGSGLAPVPGPGPVPGRLLSLVPVLGGFLVLVWPGSGRCPFLVSGTLLLFLFLALGGSASCGFPVLAPVLGNNLAPECFPNIPVVELQQLMDREVVLRARFWVAYLALLRAFKWLFRINRV